MSELIVFAFENETGAKELETGLIAAQSDLELRVNDAALVVRLEDGRPVLNHAVNLAGQPGWYLLGLYSRPGFLG